MSERIPAGGAYRTAVGLHEPLNVEHIRSTRSFISTYCSYPSTMCIEAIRMLQRASRLIAEIRLNDLAGKGDYTGIDSGILEIHSRLVGFYALYISGLIVTYGEHVLAKVLSSFKLDDRMLEPGDIVRVDPERAAGLYIAGFIEPVISNAIKLKPWSTT